MARERMLAGKAADPSANLREGSEPSRKASDDAAAADNVSARSTEAVIGRRYNRAKKDAHSRPGNVGNRKPPDRGVQTDDRDRSCDKLAKEHGVGSSTVFRAGKFAAADVSALGPWVLKYRCPRAAR